MKLLLLGSGGREHAPAWKIALVKVVWGGPAGESLTWEREDQMKESYPALFA